MDDVATCRICGSAARPLRRGTARYLRCRRCDALTRDISAEGYAALDVSYDPDPLLAQRSRQELRSLLRVDDKRAVLQRATPRAGRKPRRFIDIGCGQGGYLCAAQELGYEVVGVEPSPGHSEVAREVFGFAVETGYFTPGMFAKGSFDLAMLSHVIEHIYDPDAFLAGALELLAPGGTLVVVTPNAASTVALASGPWWTMLKPVDHVSMLAPRTVRHLASLTGHTVRVRTSEFPSEPATATLAAARDAVKATLRRDAAHGSASAE
ncbi:MAG: hypothetical protein CVU23_07745, partial [Betaproteobacteria bacterium HGW-Betaproteobacteria-17]